ncbi:MAG: aldehyde dehydrogenase family protein, partial [Anaerolineae bacterium]|nr:aldehyde dehydrogenase family protein [Anaerolineae bacterium]
MSQMLDPAQQIDEKEQQLLDACLSKLQAKASTWATLPLSGKIELLQRASQNLSDHAQEWVACVNAQRQIEQHSIWAAEEWYEIYTLAHALQGYQLTLTRLDRGEQWLPKHIDTQPNGQIVAHLFPTNTFDRLLFNGISTEVWMQPGITKNNLKEHIGTAYTSPTKGAVSLVLGAGNVNSISPLDVLDKLFVHGEVVILKLNPVNAYLHPLYEKVLAPFIDAGFLSIVEGGVPVGSYLVHHPQVDSVHITGGIQSYNTILYGPGEEGLRRKQLGEPLLKKPITSELGGASPVIVVPGQWTEADIQFQAENIATMKLYNGGFNCVSAQVLVLPEEWAQREQLVEAIQHLFQQVSPMHAYYPGALQRQLAVQNACPDAQLFAGDVPRTLVPTVSTDEARTSCFQNEIFAPVLTITTLPGKTAVSYLKNAIKFCNESLVGNLGANVIVSPEVQSSYKEEVETAVSDLRYGAIGVNVWGGLIYRLTQNPWGAFQDPEATDIGSGKGMVHNTLLFDKPQKSVIRGQFRPFPRSWRHGNPVIMPKPPWFITHRQRMKTA